MEPLMEILKNLHPDVDFETCTTLVDDRIIDSFESPLRISCRRTLTQPRLFMS